MAAFYSCLRGKNSDCDMASGPAGATAAQEPSDTAEECPGKKKSKFQTFKNFFAKKKKKETSVPVGESGLKTSQSSSDLNAPELTPITTDNDNDSESKMNLGNKALSHDSVFTSESPSSEPNEALRTSQDSIHGKVKSLQIQLKQAIRLGTPPATVSTRKGEDAGVISEDDGLPCSPPEYSTLHTVLTTSSQRSSGVVQRSSSLSLERSDSDDEMSNGASSRPCSPQVSVPVDFSQPPSSLTCLDSSAARHRIAVKTKACAKRKPASWEMLQCKGRDLREKVLLKDTESKLRVVRTRTEEEENEANISEDVPGSDEEHDESQPGNSVIGYSEEEEEEEEEPVTSSQSQRASTRSVSEEMSEEEKRVPDEDHVPDFEIPESSWEMPVTLDLQADDFLLDAECEVVSEKQGSLLEEVLSSLKGPLTSGLVLDKEVVVKQMEEEDETEVTNNPVEETTPDLPDSINPNLPLVDQVTLHENTLCETDQLPQDVEESSENEPEPEEQEVAEKLLVEEEVPEAVTGKEEDEDEEEEQEERNVLNEDKRNTTLEDTEEVGVEPEDEETKTQDEVRVEIEDGETNMEDNRDEENNGEFEGEGNKEVEEKEAPKEEEVVEEICEDTEEAEEDNVDEVEEENESKDQESHMHDEEEKEELRETIICPNFKDEGFNEPDQSVKSSALISTHLDSQPEDLPSHQPVERPSFVVSTSLDLSLPKRVPNIPKEPTEMEVEPENLHLATTETPDDVEQLQEHFLASSESANENPHAPIESPEKSEEKVSESQPRFTIAPAWQRSLSGESAKEPHQEVVLSAVEDEPAFKESPVKDQLVKAEKSERPVSPIRTQSVPSLPVQKEIYPAHEESTPENPFGVRLRKTAVLHRYASEGESSNLTSQDDAAEAQSSPIFEQLSKKPALPKKPDQMVDGSVKPKRGSELAVDRGSTESSESPSWISVARQKQKFFKENSLEESSERKFQVGISASQSQEEFNKNGSLPDLSNPANKDQLKPVASAVKVSSCSLEISKPALVEKENKRNVSHPTHTPVSQDEPPWLALAKKKAKAWSEMPQIVQ